MKRRKLNEMHFTTLVENTFKSSMPNFFKKIVKA